MKFTEIEKQINIRRGGKYSRLNKRKAFFTIDYSLSIG